MPSRNSQGTTGNRVCRGGSWNNNAHNCRLANRNNNQPDIRNNHIGFRLAVAPAQPLYLLYR
ncbi:MAG TPA: SUMF1/EgtB/PvdO family nonheme iron enzyme [Chitinophagales bacterium]|nr:SUMF1/EgtB/PvdO family nonheme iron enzyme [Chitinophagales bacterium]